MDPQPFKGCGDVACLLEAVAVKTLDKQKMKHLKAAAPSGGDSWFFVRLFSIPGLVITSHTVDGSEIPRPTS